MKRRMVLGQPLIVLLVLIVFFICLFYWDNKYQTPPPYGKSGVITLKEEDLERGRLVFLIDGWLLTDSRVRDKPTYIGEFSNLQRGDTLASPHGKARYQLTLQYDGRPKLVSVDFFQLSFDYEIFLNGTKQMQGVGNGQITFLIIPGRNILTVETTSELGYYSGMYFPPALGTGSVLLRTGRIQSFAYALAFLLPLALAVFTLFLWRTGGSLSRWFGALCFSYAFYVLRYFVFLFSLPVARYWFWVQNLVLYGLCFCIMKLTVLASDASGSRAWRWMKRGQLGISLLLLLLCLMIPVIPWAVFVHGRLTDFYYMFIFCGAVLFAVRGIRGQSWESRYTLTGCAAFGVGLVTNLIFSNRFEPIRFFWQFEWCGLLLVLLFGAMMISRSRRILQENDALTNHLEEQVKERTREVEQLLEERKSFFSDMAHDLKAPVFATQSFIAAIRRSNVGVDLELQNYLDLAEAKQREMAWRLQGLSVINALDKIEGERVRVSLQEKLSEVYEIHRGEAEVQAVHLFVELPEPDGFLMVQPEKLDILFENLIFNALKATPRNGSITISAQVGEGKIRVTVEDMGCGIPKEELPFLFQRFYVSKENQGTGTGLGLYIVQSIVTELGGTIQVQSVIGKGTRFIMEFCEGKELQTGYSE